MCIKEIILILGKKSIAFSITLEPKDKTLSENDIEQVRQKNYIQKFKNQRATTLRS